MTATLPREWSRGPQWLAGNAEARWGPVLERARAAWQQIELGSITEGLRESALVHLTVDEVARASHDLAGMGLELAVLESSAVGARAAATRPGLAWPWHEAWAAGDDARIAELLGFPPCCVAFFIEHWRDGGRADVVPFMETVEGPWEANILLRWLGVRLVPHLPCSGGCEATVEAARRYLEVGRAIRADVDALEALLRLPVTYDSHQGVTIVSTPHFRLMAGGVEGPIRRERAGEDAPPPSRPGVGGADPADNGFSSLEAQEAAHRVVAAAVGGVSSALDLGAGNGALLARIAAGRPGRWVGIEADAVRAARAVPGVELRHGALEARKWGGPYDVALLMPGRLREIGGELVAEMVRAALRDAAARVVAYAYGDVLERAGSLRALAESVGLTPHGPVLKGPGVQACEVIP